MNKERFEELKKVKQIIKNEYKDYDCGLFRTRNCVGDFMIDLFAGKYFIVDGCYHYSYFEIFGITQKEFEEIKKIYDKLGEHNE